MKRSPSFSVDVPTPPLGKRLSLIEDLCDGLAHAHAAGIIHRDIKPANIMLDAEGVLKILDFGIARLGNSGMTQDGMMMGTVNYMSPEQVVGRGVDHRTDIFATGAVLYEAIALDAGLPRADRHRRASLHPQRRAPCHSPSTFPTSTRSSPGSSSMPSSAIRSGATRTCATCSKTSRAFGAGSTQVSKAGRRRHGPGPTIPRCERRGPGSRSALPSFGGSRSKKTCGLARKRLRGATTTPPFTMRSARAMVDPDNPRAVDLIDKARFAIEAKVIRHLLTRGGAAAR